MKFLTVRELRSQASKVWKDLPEEREMIVTSNGRPVALLTPVNEDNLEASLKAWRRARAMQATEALQREAVRQGKDRMSMGEIEREIAASRRRAAR